MAKGVFLIEICMAYMFYGCNNNNNIPEYKLDSIAHKIYDKTISDSTCRPGFIYDIVNYKDSLIFYTDMFMRGIYKHDMTNGKTSKLGREGRGPGEYLQPTSLEVGENELYFNDQFTNSVIAYDFNGKYLRDYESKKFVKSQRMIRTKSGDIIFLNNGVHFRNYLTSVTGEEFYKVQKCFYSFKRPISPREFFEYNDIIYFMNPYELMIMTYDRKTDKEGVIEFGGVRNSFSWEDNYDRNIDSEKDLKEIEEAKYKVLEMIPLLHRGKLFFIIHMADKDKEYAEYYVYNDKGNPVFKFTTERSIPYGYNDGKLYCYYSADGKVFSGLRAYKFDEIITKAL